MTFDQRANIHICLYNMHRLPSLHYSLSTDSSAIPFGRFSHAFFDRFTRRLLLLVFLYPRLHLIADHVVTVCTNSCTWHGVNHTYRTAALQGVRGVTMTAKTRDRVAPDQSRTGRGGEHFHRLIPL